MFHQQHLDRVDSLNHNSLYEIGPNAWDVASLPTGYYYHKWGQNELITIHDSTIRTENREARHKDLSGAHSSSPSYVKPRYEGMSREVPEWDIVDSKEFQEPTDENLPELSSEPSFVALPNYKPCKSQVVDFTAVAEEPSSPRVCLPLWDARPLQRPSPFISEPIPSSTSGSNANRSNPSNPQQEFKSSKKRDHSCDSGTLKERKGLIIPENIAQQGKYRKPDFISQQDDHEKWTQQAQHLVDAAADPLTSSLRRTHTHNHLAPFPRFRNPWTRPSLSKRREPTIQTEAPADVATSFPSIERPDPPSESLELERRALVLILGKLRNIPDVQREILDAWDKVPGLQLTKEEEEEHYLKIIDIVEGIGWDYDVD